MSYKTKIAVLLTTFNRCEATIACLESLYKSNENIDFRFVVVDDNSKDDTVAEIEKLPIRVKVISGDGNLYWNGGMRKAIDFALHSADKFQYALLVNDDVLFEKNAITKLIERQKACDADVVVGATCDSIGGMSYGGVRRLSKVFAKFELIEPSDECEKCDTFNCNCVLLTSEALKKAGNLDARYKHSMGDYDYGIAINKLGMTVINSCEYVGHCNDNDSAGTWHDTKLPRVERLKLKEGIKGLPAKDWFHFVNKNYGLLPAIYHSITPYIRILIGK